MTATTTTWHSALRISGALVHDADLRVSSGAEPRGWLVLAIQPPKGLPYLARIDIGTSVAVHQQTAAELLHLRAGTVVSLAGDALELAADHGTAALRVLAPRDLVAFGRPIPVSHRPQPAPQDA